MVVYDWLNDLAQLSHSIATVKPFHSSSWSHRFPDAKSGLTCIYLEICGLVYLIACSKCDW